MRDGYGFNEGEMCLILSWFGVQQSILHSCGDISVLLVLWQSCWGSLEFNQAKRGSLCVWLGKRNCSACNAGESGLISRRGGSLMGFLELRQARGVYSRVTTEMPILNGSLFSEVRTLVYVWRTPRDAKLCLVGQYGRYWRWGGRPSVPY